MILSIRNSSYSLNNKISMLKTFFGEWIYFSFLYIYVYVNVGFLLLKKIYSYAIIIAKLLI